MYYLIILAVLGTSVVAFFAWANHRTRKRHAHFRTADVRVALEEVLSDDSSDHDTFDLFLAWPIDDPYLESIRKRCICLLASDEPEEGRDISQQAAEEFRIILAELSGRA